MVNILIITIVYLIIFVYVTKRLLFAIAIRDKKPIDKVLISLSNKQICLYVDEEVLAIYTVKYD